MSDESDNSAIVDGAGTPEDIADLGAAPDKSLTPEAVRALIEARDRRRTRTPAALPVEIDGRDGEEPTRFGDWEKKGLAIDF